MDCGEEGSGKDKQQKGLTKIDQKKKKNRNVQDIEQKEMNWNEKQEEVEQVCLSSSRSNPTDKAEMKVASNQNSSRNRRNSVS